VWRWQQRYGEKGVDGLLRDKPPLRRDIEERIIALMRDPSPASASNRE